MGKLKRFLSLVVVLSLTACAMAPAPAPAPVPAKPKTIQTFEPIVFPKPAVPPKPAVQQQPSSTVSKQVPKAQAPKTSPSPKPVNKPVISPKPVVVQPEVSAELHKAIEPVLEQKLEVRKIESKPMSLSLLPIRFGTSWTLDRRPNPVTKTTECLLISDPLTIADGYENTRVQLLLTTDMLYVKTGSNIDLGYPQSGVQIDSGPIWKFDSVIKEKSVQLETDYEEIVSQFSSGKTVTAHLGFWPTWPMTETRKASFSLEEMEDSISRLTDCEKM